MRLGGGSSCSQVDVVSSAKLLGYSFELRNDYIPNFKNTKYVNARQCVYLIKLFTSFFKFFFLVSRKRVREIDNKRERIETI